jgi:hypothetical protein
MRDRQDEEREHVLFVKDAYQSAELKRLPAAAGSSAPARWPEPAPRAPIGGARSHELRPRHPTAIREMIIREARPMDVDPQENRRRPLRNDNELGALLADIGKQFGDGLAAAGAALSLVANAQAAMGWMIQDDTARAEMAPADREKVRAAALKLAELVEKR